MIKLIQILFFVLIGTSNVIGVDNSPSKINWEAFKRFHGKVYTSLDEELTRRRIFEKNAGDVVAHNEAFRQGKVSYSKELNSFADIDPVEFGKRNVPEPDNLTEITRAVYPDPHNYEDVLPASFDWRDRNMVSPVKNQGQCGSWAFSAIGAIESQILINSGGQLLDILSEQQLVDCDVENHGCKGGLATNAFEYIHKNGGIESENAYPYISFQGESGLCKYSTSNVVADVLGFVRFYQKDQQFIKQALYQNGPISFSIDASDLQLYSNGIYSCDKEKVKVNHAVLLVGYGNSETGEGYWIVKNSFGTKWGSQGFFRVSRQTDRDCGLTTRMSYPQVKAKIQKQLWYFDMNEWKSCFNLDSINTLFGLLIIFLLFALIRNKRNTRMDRLSEIISRKFPLGTPVIVNNRKV